MGVKRPVDHSHSEFLEFYRFIDMMVEVITKNNIGLETLAHDRMQDKLIELLKRRLIPEKDITLFLKYAVVKYFFRGEAGVAEIIHKHILDNLEALLESLKGSKNVFLNILLGIVSDEDRQRCFTNTTCGAFMYVQNDPNIKVLDIKQDSRHRALYLPYGYGNLINGIITIIHAAVEIDNDLSIILPHSRNIAQTLSEYKTFSDKLHSILTSFSHDIYTTFNGIKSIYTDTQQNIDIISRELQPPPQEGGKKQFYIFKGRRYKIYTQGKHTYIHTKEGKMSVSKACKEQARYEKEKARAKAKKLTHRTTKSKSITIS